MKTRIAVAAFALAAFISTAFADQLLPVGDSFFATGNNTNFGSSPTINVGGAGPYRGLVQFDLTTLPAGTTAASIAHANLVLFVNKIGTAGAIDVNAATGAWTEATVNGPTSPAIGMTIATGVPVNTASVYVVIDATAVVKAWLNGNPPNQGLIVSANTGSPATSVFFDSKESATTSHPAILDISFVGGGGAAGPAGPTGPQGPQGAQGPIGATGPSGSLTLPYGGSTTFNGSAFDVQNFQLGNGNSFSVAAIKGTGGSSFAGGNSGSGGIGRIGVSSTDTQPGVGGVFSGGASAKDGGPGVGATGGNSVSGTGGIGVDGQGGIGSDGGSGVRGIGGDGNGAVVPFGGAGIYGQGGDGGFDGGAGGVFLGGQGGVDGGLGIAVIPGLKKGTQTPAMAALFHGDVDVKGTLSKFAGSFKIDHPLDPANKTLSHSFVESPDMMNLYNGIVTLDADGSAWIEMPYWFEALNRDFRYQLTAVGAPGPNLYIASTIEGNRFQIAGGSSGARVSWMVTGIRHDTYADAHRIPLEQDKTPAEKDHYLHPEALRQSIEKGSKR